MKLEYHEICIPYTKVNSKWFKDLNIRHKTIRFLEENIGEIFSDINLSPNMKEVKVKLNK